MNFINKKKVAATIVFLSIMALVFLIMRAFFYAPNDEVPLSTNQARAEFGEFTAKPIHIEIPKINVSADILPVGVTASGNMAAPRGYKDVGWYKYGTIPGNVGSAVLAGHVDNGVALPAVFYDLKNLEVGDNIYLTNEEGERLYFTVEGKEIYDYNAKPEEVFNDDSGRFIKLITCSGSWIKEIRTRDKRLVVTARLSSEN